MILRGREGWLFLQGDTNDVIGQHEGRVMLGDGSGAWEEVIADRVGLQRALDFVWACEIVPDKESVYAEFLPESVHPAERRPVHEVLDIGRRHGPETSYLLADLEAAKPEGDLYSPIDTHWNHRGAFAAYRAICARLRERGIGLETLDRDRVEWTHGELQGDLGGKLIPPVAGATVTATVPEGRSLLLGDNCIRHNGRVLIFEREAPALPSCLVFGESFAYQLLPFLSESFSRLVFVHTSAIIEEVIAAERPDAVISLPIERFMIRAPVDRDSFETLAATVAAKTEANELVLYDPHLSHLPRREEPPSEIPVGKLPWPPGSRG